MTRVGSSGEPSREEKEGPLFPAMAMALRGREDDDSVMRLALVLVVATALPTQAFLPTLVPAHHEATLQPACRLALRTDGGCRGRPRGLTALSAIEGAQGASTLQALRVRVPSGTDPSVVCDVLLELGCLSATLAVAQSACASESGPSSFLFTDEVPRCPWTFACRGRERLSTGRVG